MILTRKLQAPWTWVAVIHLFSIFATYGLMLKGMPLVLLAGRFEPVYAVKYALSFSAVAIFTIPLGMVAPWLSDRIWTRWGRRKPFMVLSDSLQALCLLLLPFTASIGSIVFLWAIFLIADALDAGPRGALVWEIIPARQRARSTVFRYLSHCCCCHWPSSPTKWIDSSCCSSPPWSRSARTSC